MKNLLVLLICIIVVLGIDAKYGKQIRHGRISNFQRILRELNSCRHAGLTPCLGEVPVRCFSRFAKCNGLIFCRRYHDDELGCSGITDVDQETRTFTIRWTSTVSTEHHTRTATSYTTTTLTSPLTTYTTKTTSTTSLTPIIHPSNSMTTTSVTSEYVATIVEASSVVGFVPGPGAACINLALAIPPERKKREYNYNEGNGGVVGNLRKKRQAFINAGANRYSLSMGSFDFTGTLLATAVCTQASIKI